MNIFHICNVTAKPDGIKSVLKKLSVKQKEIGNSVRTFSLKEGDSDFEHLSSIRQFYKVIQSDRPDIVIFHSIYYFLYIPFVIILWLRKIPYGIMLHGALSFENYKVSHIKKRIANILFFNQFIKHAKSIIYLNDNEYHNSIVKTINSNYTIIPNGCDRILELNYETEHPNDPIQIVYIGRINRIHKGLDILLDAIELIQGSELCKKVRFTFYGDGNDLELSWFKERIQQVSSIAEFKGPIYGECKDDVMRKSDIFILTSRFEGMPMGVLEALSYGLPCILTPGTNIGEEVKAADAGWLTDAKSDKIAEVINKAVKELYLKRNLLKSNAIELSKKYDWSNIAMMSINEYQKMINK